MKINKNHFSLLLMVLCSTAACAMMGEDRDWEYWDLIKGGTSHLEKPDFHQINDEGYRSYTSHQKATKEPSRCAVQLALIDEDGIEGLGNTEIALYGLENDRRKEVENAKRWPYLPLTRLIINFEKRPDRNYAGSGSLIGPSHILTAGHNVYDHKDHLEEAKRIIVRPTLHQSIFPREVQVSRIYTTKKWLENGNNTEDDIALLILSEPIGYEVGWHGLSFYNPERFIRPDASNPKPLNESGIRVAGYPGIKPKTEKEVCNSMWVGKSKIYHVEGNLLKYDIDTGKGQSGSPVILGKDLHEIIGVHTRGGDENDANPRNMGVYITREKLGLLVTWIDTAYETRGHYNPFFHVDLYTTDFRDLFRKGWEHANKDDEDVKKRYPVLLHLNPREADRRALALFHRAAELGSAEAENWIGEMYLHGRIVEAGIYKENRQKAIEYFERALLTNPRFAQAQDNLAVMYQYSENPNYEKAIALLEQISKRRTNTIEQKENAENRITFIGKLQHMLELAEKENPQAQLILAEKYSSGNGFLKNYDKAVSWFKRVANNKNSSENQVKEALNQINVFNFLAGNIPEEMRGEEYTTLKNNYELVEAAVNKQTKTAHKLLEGAGAKVGSLAEILSLLEAKILVVSAASDREKLQQCHNDLSKAMEEKRALLQDIEAYWDSKIIIVERAHHEK